MAELDDGTGTPGQRVPKLPSFGKALSRITAHFTLEGALGLRLIDAICHVDFLWLLPLLLRGPPQTRFARLCHVW